VYRVVARRGAIERACQNLLGEKLLRVEDGMIEFYTREARQSVWRIGTTFLILC